VRILRFPQSSNQVCGNTQVRCNMPEERQCVSYTVVQSADCRCDLLQLHRLSNNVER
jgi:hypothetical protein